MAEDFGRVPSEAVAEDFDRGEPRRHGSLLDGVRDYAHGKPMAFLGIAMLGGFALGHVACGARSPQAS